MDIRKPKAIHNTREFFKEVGTIVLGVCIALAAEQGVEWWHWRSQVQQAREVIASEMAQNIGSAIIAWRSQICTERRLDELAAILDKASETGRLPPVGDIGRPPRRAWRSGAWDTVVASEAATHFPREELAKLGSIYTFVHLIGDTSDFEPWNTLYTMVGPGRRLDPASETALRQAVTEARARIRRIANGGVLLLDQVQAMNLPFSQQDRALMTDLRLAAQNSENLGYPELASLRGGFVGICGPIGAVPAHYGQAIPSQTPALTDDRLRNLPQFGGQ